jgi:hypothetical protein
MRIGDVLSSPTGTLTVVGFETVDGTTEAGAACSGGGDEDSGSGGASTFAPNPNGCSICTTMRSSKGKKASESHIIISRPFFKMVQKS